jgi:hypothetical protein
MGSGIMGDILPSAAAREMHIDAKCMASVDYVRIIKNGRIAFSGIPEQHPDAEDSSFTVRLEFGWDAMTSEMIKGQATLVNPFDRGVRPP